MTAPSLGDIWSNAVSLLGIARAVGRGRPVVVRRRLPSPSRHSQRAVSSAAGALRHARQCRRVDGGLLASELPGCAAARRPLGGPGGTTSGRAPLGRGLSRAARTAQRRRVARRMMRRAPPRPAADAFPPRGRWTRLAAWSPTGGSAWTPRTSARGRRHAPDDGERVHACAAGTADDSSLQKGERT